jgi:hypothetical protein
MNMRSSCGFVFILAFLIGLAQIGLNHPKLVFDTETAYAISPNSHRRFLKAGFRGSALILSFSQGEKRTAHSASLQ